MGQRRWASIACAVVLFTACSGGADGETEVLGTVTERATTAPVAAAPAPPVTAAPLDTPTPAVSPSATPTPAPTATASPESTPTPVPAATPTPDPPAEPEGDGPEPLEAGEGWSLNTLVPDGGEAWTEVSGAPPIGEDGSPEVRLFVELLHEPVTGDQAGRVARCRAWLEAAAAPLEARGSVTVALRVAGRVVREATHPVEGMVSPGARVDLPPWDPPERVHALDGEAVTCTASYAPSG